MRFKSVTYYPSMHPYSHILRLFLHERQQVNPVELSQHLPSQKLHLKSIATGLQHIRLDIMYAIHALTYYFSNDDRAYNPHTVARVLTSATVQLEGLLDGLIICSLPVGTPATRKMNFRTTQFSDPQLQTIQERVKDLKSFSKTNRSTYADFWTIADFWKHYLPCLPLPKEFEERRLDFQIELGTGLSGPILHDLIIPVFNGACDIVEFMSNRLFVEDIETIERISGYNERHPD